MSDLRKRFEKETGKTVGEIGIYECDNCGNDQLEIETWNDNYVFWLENLANGADKSTEPVLHKHIVSNSLVADIRNKLTPPKNLCAMIKALPRHILEDTQFEDLIIREVEQTEKSIDYLSNL